MSDETTRNDLLASCCELRSALASAMWVIAVKGAAEVFEAELRLLGIPNGIGVRANAAIAKAQAVQAGRTIP